MTEPAKAGSPLTRREAQVLRLIANGHTYGQTATALVISEGTVRSHAQRLLARLGARDQAHAVALAFAGGIIGPADIGRTEAAEEACAAQRGAVQRLLVLWRRTNPPRDAALNVLWWRQRLDELSNAIRKDTGQ